MIGYVIEYINRIFNEIENALLNSKDMLNLLQHHLSELNFVVRLHEQCKSFHKERLILLRYLPYLSIVIKALITDLLVST